MGVSDLVDKIRQGRQEVICVLPSRKMSTNDACDLAEALKTNTTLLQFYASGHPIGLAAIQAFAAMLKRNVTLKKLCIGDAEMGDLGIIALAEGLRENKALVELDLERRGFGPDGAVALSTVLELHPSLEVLNISRNELNDQSITALSQGLAKAINLCVYQCNDQAFGRTGVLALASMLAKHPSLTDISMAQNDMQDGQESLADAIRLSKLEVVNLEACELSTGFVKELGVPCRSLSLVELNLNRNQLQAQDAPYLVQIMKQCRQMKKLHLGHNSLTDVGAEILATHLSQPNTDPLELLDLSKNELSCTSMNTLLIGAKIGELRLFQNALGDGATTVTSALRSNTQLKVLDLGANELHRERAVCILDALRYNTTLEVLEFGGNDLGQIGLDKLEQLKQDNPRLDVAADKKATDNNPSP